MRDVERVSETRLYRDGDGLYHVYVDFDVHAESNGGFATVEGALTWAARTIADELRTRKTVEVPAMPAAVGGNGNG